MANGTLLVTDGIMYGILLMTDGTQLVTAEILLVTDRSSDTIGDRWGTIGD